MPPSVTKPITTTPASLTSVQVDVSTRLGALAPATATGLAGLDRMLAGGLRAGMHLVVSGRPGVGKTALGLMVAYMAARARAAVLYAAPVLDDTEVVARLTARALHREYSNVDATYGTIWSGAAMQDPALRGPISGCMSTVTKKVGGLLHLHDAEPGESIAQVAALAASLSSRHERVVVVVDGVEAFGTMQGGGSDGSFEGRVLQVGYELKRLASHGCAVVSLCSAAHAHLLSPGASVAAEVRRTSEGSIQRASRTGELLDYLQVELDIVKNRLGPTGSLPMYYVPAASVFEEPT